MPRAKGIQIYLKEGIEEDEVLLNLWEICKTHSRPQEIFRRMLQKGLKEMIKSNELSDSIISELSIRSDKDFDEQPLQVEQEPKLYKKPATAIKPKDTPTELDNALASTTQNAPPKAHSTPKVEVQQTSKPAPSQNNPKPKQDFSDQLGLISKDLM